MFDDIEKKGFEKQMEELRAAIANLVEIVKPLAEEAKKRAERDAMRLALSETHIGRQIIAAHRCDCSPSRAGFLASWRTVDDE